MQEKKSIGIGRAQFDGVVMEKSRIPRGICKVGSQGVSIIIEKKDTPAKMGVGVEGIADGGIDLLVKTLLLVLAGVTIMFAFAASHASG